MPSHKQPFSPLNSDWHPSVASSACKEPPRWFLAGRTGFCWRPLKLLQSPSLQPGLAARSYLRWLLAGRPGFCWRPLKMPQLAVTPAIAPLARAVTMLDDQGRKPNHRWLLAGRPGFCWRPLKLQQPPRPLKLPQLPVTPAIAPLARAVMTLDDQGRKHTSFQPDPLP